MLQLKEQTVVRSIDISAAVRAHAAFAMRTLLTIQITGDDFISSQTYERLEEDYRHVGYNQGIIHVVLDNSRG